LPLAGRGRRAIDPFNAILNYFYALLEAQCRYAINLLGFDPACGFLHVDKPHRDSLVNDLIEPSRT
jgi:CRISPR/Cas system-associated endonuclease Cas1